MSGTKLGTGPNFRHDVRRKLGPVPNFVLLALIASNGAWALNASDLPQLVALDERVVAHMQGPELVWSPEGDYLLVAGYDAAREATAAVVPLDGRPVLPVPNLASPRLVCAPYGGRLACWQRGAPSPTGASQFLLSIFDPRLGACVPIAGIPPFESAPPVVWLPDPELIGTLRQLKEHTVLVLYDPVAEKLAPLVVTVAGVGTVLRPATGVGRVIVGTVELDGTPEYYLIDTRTGVASNVPEGERAATLTDAAASAPPGTSQRSGLVAICRQDGLLVSAPGQGEPRRLLPRGNLGAHGFTAVAPPVWSPTEEHVAYTTRADDGLADVRLVTLGLEEIVCELFYPMAEKPPAPGATVWVCMDLQLDAKGRVIEPKWNTLKAQLEVTSSPLEAPNGLLVRARSVGLGEEVLKRLTGIADPPAEMEDDRNLRFGPAGTTPQTVLRSFTLPARSGLLAWSQGVSTGQVLSVRVTRRALFLIGAPAGD